MTDSAAAVECVRAVSPEIPFWPQLPRIGPEERAIGQELGAVYEWIEARPGAYGYRVKPGKLEQVLEYFHDGAGELSPAHASGFFAFERCANLAGFPQAVATKGQIEGPITLASHLFHGNRPFVSDVALFAAVVAHVRHLVAWQAQRLQRLGLPALLFIDEPGLCIPEVVQHMTVDDDDLIEGLQAVVQTGRESGATVGLHCCAARPFSRMCLVGPDILSFDAYHDMEGFAADADVRTFLDQGGWAAYGLIPTLSRLDGLSAEAIFSSWLKAVVRLGDLRDIARRSFITATCGLGLLDKAAAEPTFRLCRAVGALVRRIAASGLAGDFDDGV